MSKARVELRIAEATETAFPGQNDITKRDKKRITKIYTASNLSTNQCRLLLHDCSSSLPRVTSTSGNASDRDNTNITIPQENGQQQQQLTSRFWLADVVSSATVPEALAAPAVVMALHPADLHAQLRCDNGRRRVRAAVIG